jgi:hypothetical protein
MSSATIVDAAHEVGEVVEAHADDGERSRRLPMPTVKALAGAGLMRMCVPAVYGGPEIDPPTMVEAIEAVARADGAAGWCSMIASTTASMAAYLPAATAEEIYGDPSSITGGVFAPNGTGTATTVDGRQGFAVTGRWAWGSGGWKRAPGGLHGKTLAKESAEVCNSEQHGLCHGNDIRSHQKPLWETQTLHTFWFCSIRYNLCPVVVDTFREQTPSFCILYCSNHFV